MLRYRGRTMQLGVGRRGFDPRWTGIPPSTGDWSALRKTITSKKSPPMVGSSRPPPTLWGGSQALPGSGSSTRPPPHAAFLKLPSPSNGVPLTSPPASPASSRVGKANCSRPSSASCPSSPYQGVFPHSPSAAVRVPSPRSGTPLLSAPASHARTIVGTDKWFWPPPSLCPWTGPPPTMAGSSRPPLPAPWGGSSALPAGCLSTGPPPHAGFLQLRSPSDDVPLPSPPASPAPSRVGKANCSRPSSALSAYEAAGVALPSPRPGVPLLSAPASHTHSIMGTDRSFWPRSELCPLTPPGAGLMLLDPGTGVPLPSPPQRYRRGGTGTNKSYQPPEIHGHGGIGMYKSYQLPQSKSNARSGTGTYRSYRSPSMLCVSTGLKSQASRAGVSLLSPAESQHSCLMHLSTVVPNTNRQLVSLLKCRGYSSVVDYEEAYLEPIKADGFPRSIKYSNLQDHTKLEMFDHHFIGATTILESANQDIDQFSSQMFDLAKLKKLYSDLVKPMIVASGLHINSEAADDTYVRDLMEKLCTDLKKPYLRCITSLDLMKALIALPNWKWAYLIEYLRDSKAMIIERWDQSLGTIENMVYNFGWKVPLDGQKLHKGQTDASYKNNIATLCSIMFDEDDQIKDCCVCVDVACKSSVEAELMSMYMLERRSIDMGVQNLLAITDNDHVFKILKELIIPSGEYKDLSKTLVGLKSKFETFLCHREAREQLFFPDSLATSTEEYLRKFDFEAIISTWSPLLLGFPLFRVHQTENAIKKFLGTMTGGGTLTLHSIYKVNLNDESEKLHAITNVLKSVRPKYATVLLNNEDKAHIVEKELIRLYTAPNVGFLEDGKSYMVNLDTRKDPSDDRNLTIVWDSSIEDEFDPSKITVRLLLKEKEDDLSIQNLAPECYSFFNGEAGERLKLGENIIKPNPKPE